MKDDIPLIELNDVGRQSLPLTYLVRRVRQPMVIDADFNKPCWQKTLPLQIAFVQPASGAHRPETLVKICYDDAFLYVMFQVKDQYVRAVATEMNGPVWQDSCVEFFFTPQRSRSSAYFNLEVNCIGTFLMHYQHAPKQVVHALNEDDFRAIKSAASLSGPIPVEIDTPVTWTLEYALPLVMLRLYAEVEQPDAGVKWWANFYKCADHCSRPHWLSWSPILSSMPDFHQPQCFGLLLFE